MAGTQLESRPLVVGMNGERCRHAWENNCVPSPKKKKRFTKQSYTVSSPLKRGFEPSEQLDNEQTRAQVGFKSPTARPEQEHGCKSLAQRGLWENGDVAKQHFLFLLVFLTSQPFPVPISTDGCGDPSPFIEEVERWAEEREPSVLD